MIRIVYLGFMIFVGLTNPINLNKDKKRLDLYMKNSLYLVYDK
tara:strand:+ start:65 stop:193 length:129 start_codon:yes stop_codon:yes gene_type:complete